MGPTVSTCRVLQVLIATQSCRVDLLGCLLQGGSSLHGGKRLHNQQDTLVMRLTSVFPCLPPLLAPLSVLPCLYMGMLPSRCRTRHSHAAWCACRRSTSGLRSSAS